MCVCVCHSNVTAQNYYAHGLVIGSRHVLDADRGGQKYFRIVRCVSSRCAGMKPIAKGSPEVFELSEWAARNSVRPSM